METKVIGLLTYRCSRRGFMEPKYFRDLHREGKKVGAEVVMFTEHDVDLAKRRFYGYVPGKGRAWVRKAFPWPRVVIDRRRSNWTPAFMKLRQKKLFRYTSSKFAFKSDATRFLASVPSVSRWIPKTRPFSPENLLRMMERFRIVYVKPGNGTGGSSVAKVARVGDSYVIWGRERSSRLKAVTLRDKQAVVRWFQRWVRSQVFRAGTFIVQQGLDLELVPGRNVDSRLLIQKDGSAQWQLTGMAVRIGGERSPTTNMLYGDGKAHTFDAFMEKRFGREKAATIRAECEGMARGVVRVIERRFGPMLEFGMDVGVDVQGRVWLIEANPKPSRDVFLKSGEPEVYRTALRRPIEYAMYLGEREE